MVDVLRPGHNFEASLTLNLKQILAHFDTVGKLSWLHRDVGLLQTEHVSRIFLNLMRATKIFLTKWDDVIAFRRLRWKLATCTLAVSKRSTVVLGWWVLVDINLDKVLGKYAVSSRLFGSFDQARISVDPWLGTETAFTETKCCLQGKFTRLKIYVVSEGKLVCLCCDMIILCVCLLGIHLGRWLCNNWKLAVCEHLI